MPAALWRLGVLGKRLWQRRLTRRGWYRLDARCDDPAVFIGGCGRSGTTLFRELLNRHSRFCCGPETSMFGLPFNPDHIAPYWDLDAAELACRAEASATLVEFAAWFYRDFCRRAGKPRWADKTPNNVRALPKLLTWFPRSTFVHVLRDGRDVACSLRHHPRERVVGGRIVPVKSDNPIGWCAKRWLDDVSRGFAFRSHPRYVEVRYEDLVAEPERELRRVLAHLGEAFEPAMLAPAGGDNNGSARGGAGPAPGAAGRPVNNPDAAAPVRAKHIGRWRYELGFSDRRAVVDAAGELLIAAGYVRDHTWVRDWPAAAGHNGASPDALGPAPPGFPRRAQDHDTTRQVGGECSGGSST